MLKTCLSPTRAHFPYAQIMRQGKGLTSIDCVLPIFSLTGWPLTHLLFLLLQTHAPSQLTEHLQEAYCKRFRFLSEFLLPFKKTVSSFLFFFLLLLLVLWMEPKNKEAHLKKRCVVL